MNTNRVLIVIGTLLVIAVFRLLMVQLPRFGWTGFQERTLWDVFELLSAIAIPLLVAWLVYYLNKQQRMQELRHTEALAAQARRDAALQTYKSEIKALVDQGLRTADPYSDLRIYARDLTLTALQGLDGIHWTKLFEFLHALNLVHNEEDLSVINLSGAELSNKQDVQGAYIGKVFLQSAKLEHTNLADADLSQAYLYDARLADANLQGAWLTAANLTTADLTRADLRGAHMTKMHMDGAHLNDAKFDGAFLTQVFFDGADLTGATFTGAHLTDVYFTGTEVDRAQLALCKVRRNVTLGNGEILSDDEDNPP